MASLPCYSSFDEKQRLYINGNEDSFIISTKDEINELLVTISGLYQSKSPVDLIFRGVNNAKYKLFNSAQRQWNENEFDKKGLSYIEFFGGYVEEAKRTPVLNHVYNRYGIPNEKRDFPILALLRHYGFPTPLLDWSYTIETALFFAIDDYKVSSTDTIDDYISVYMIDKTKQYEFYNSKDIFPLGIGVKGFSDWDDDGIHSNSCNYLSDFEPERYSLVKSNYPYNNLRVQDDRQETTILNHRIILQDGLLVFNPHGKKCLEEMFNISVFEEGANLEVSPFCCFNIHKSLIPFIINKVLTPKSISKEFIYPDISRIVSDVADRKKL